jgi:hypothetical protein
MDFNCYLALAGLTNGGRGESSPAAGRFGALAGRKDPGVTQSDRTTKGRFYAVECWPVAQNRSSIRGHAFNKAQLHRHVPPFSLVESSTARV